MIPSLQRDHSQQHLCTRKYIRQPALAICSTVKIITQLLPHITCMLPHSYKTVGHTLCACTLFFAALKQVWIIEVTDNRIHNRGCTYCTVNRSGNFRCLVFSYVVNLNTRNLITCARSTLTCPERGR